MAAKRVTINFNEEDIWIYELIVDLSKRKRDVGIPSTVSKEIIAKLRQEFLTIAEQRNLDQKLLEEKWDDANSQQ